LRFPGIITPVIPLRKIIIKYFYEKFNLRADSLAGLTARTIQRGCDHLNGVVFLDHNHPLEKNCTLESLKK
jgi:peptide deformylase